MVTAAPDLIPPPLINQLKAGGRMVIPVGLLRAQQLVVVEKDLNGKVTTKEIMPVLFSVLEGSEQPAFRALPASQGRSGTTKEQARDPASGAKILN
jgi:protein-L-isoaspartate O-methyltransferase